jgi:hypothetical protein
LRFVKKILKLKISANVGNVITSAIFANFWLACFS